LDAPAFDSLDEARDVSRVEADRATEVDRVQLPALDEALPGPRMNVQQVGSLRATATKRDSRHTQMHAC
jgi:hypothetical protein